MKFKALFPLLIFCYTSTLVYAQQDFKPGYVILNNNDTLTGSINLKSNLRNNRSCDFIQNGETTLRVFYPGDIKAFVIQDSKYYVSKEIQLSETKEMVFLEYLVDGIIDLYYLKNSLDENYFIEKDGTLYILSNNASLVTVKSTSPNEPEQKVYSKNSNQYQGMLRYLFQESPVVSEKISTTRFDYKPLIDLTTDYHNSVCKDYACIDYSKSTKVLVFMEAGTGIVNSWMGIKTSDNHDYAMSPLVEVRFRIKPIKRFYLWNFLVGLKYSSVDYKGDFQNSLYATITQPTEMHHISLNYSYIGIPLTVEYALPWNRFKPCFTAGFNNTIVINPEYSIYKFNEVIPTESYFRTFQIGFTGGIGIKYMLKNSSYFYLANEFEYRIPSASFGWVLDYYRDYSCKITVGYGFPLNKKVSW